MAHHHGIICTALEAVERGECNRLMIFCPPRHTKSELASRRFPSWYIGRHPDRQIIAASYNGDLASDFGRDVRNIIDSPEYSQLFPDCELAADSRAANRWNTDVGGAYVAAGVGTAITGRGAHLALIDDPVKDRSDADSQTVRDHTWNWYTNVLYTRLMPDAAIVLIMTRWHEDDLAGRLLEQQDEGGEAWEVINLPALGEGNDWREEGEALWPAWYPVETLATTRNVLTMSDGPRAWDALYQQRPSAEAGVFFKREWLRWYETVPRDLQIYAASDYAVTGSGGDWTVHGVIGLDVDDNIYVLDWWREQATSDVWVESAIDMMAKWSPIRWAEERGQIEKGVGPFLAKRMQERRVYVIREGLTSASDKAPRARSIQGRMSMGKVFFPKKQPWCEELVNELMRFRGEGHEVDDQVDVLGMFGRLLESMYGAASALPERNTDFRSGGNVVDELRRLARQRA